MKRVPLNTWIFLQHHISFHISIAYCDRKCKHCDQGEVGNEQHYLKCHVVANTMFTFLRQNLINSVYKINQSFKYFDTQSLFQ